jgi:arylsulfatase A-like enzyme
VHYYDAHGPYAVIPGIEYPSGTSGDEALYDGALRSIDRELGRLLAAIEARTSATYVILTADHGSLFGPLQGRRPHHYGDDLSTAVLHVPLIVAGPGIAPRRVDSLASTMDILPTLVDLLDVKPKATLEGDSLWPQILHGTVQPSRVLFHEFYLGERDFQGRDPLEQVSVRDSEWNLTLDRTKGVYHLYDYRNDYAEQRDLFEDAGRSPHALRLRALLGGFVEAFHKRAPGTAVLAPPSHDQNAD